MRSILKTLQTEPCRSRDISTNEFDSFSNYTHLQRYNPALDMFTIPDSLLSHKNVELPSKYQINSWISQDKPKFWKATRSLSAKTVSETAEKADKVIQKEQSAPLEQSEQIEQSEQSEQVVQLEQSDKLEQLEQSDKLEQLEQSDKLEQLEQSEQSESCDVFTKIIHLLNPIDMMKEKYVCPEHPLLPQSEKTWKSTLLKLHSHNNQAYVDATANFILSRFRELDLTPHCILFYGSYTGISKSYQYNITNEYDTYRQCRWFWKGMESHSAKIVLQHDGSIDDIPNYDDIYKEITTCPFDKDEELEELLDEASDNTDTKSIASITSFTFDNIEEETENSKNIFEINKNITNSSFKSNNKKTVHKSSKDIDSKKTHVSDKKSNGSYSSSDRGSYSGSESGSYSGSYSGSDYDSDCSSNDSDETVQLDLNICLEIPNMPIIIINQEAQEGIMDTLIDDDEIDGYERGSQGWELRWIAWLFQIIAALTFLQSAICFTHNDLHSNNILWRATDLKYLYYKIKDGTVWRIPTFGKIFSIIDFGRSIFRLGKHLWVSDDHWPDQDASDQYNFGPFFDHNKPKNLPNPSFDLCRLSVSLIDGLFDEIPYKKKGKKVPIMSQEGSWKVYETKSNLYNLLWNWTVNDAGNTIYEDKDGNEKYDGFELYIRIAHDIHSAVPRDQLHRPVFQQFIWKNKVPNNVKVYSLGV